MTFAHLPILVNYRVTGHNGSFLKKNHIHVHVYVTMLTNLVYILAGMAGLFQAMIDLAALWLFLLKCTII